MGRPGGAALLLLCAAVTASCGAEHRPASPRSPEPQQLMFAGIGAGATRPAAAGGPESMDDEVTAHLAVGIDSRQRGFYGYVRASSDLGGARQRAALTFGARAHLPGLDNRLRPYLGAGFGALFLIPSQEHSYVLRRITAPRGEAAAGLDWQPIRGLTWYLEYQISASRHVPAVLAADAPRCGPGELCPDEGPDRLRHVGHVLSVGLRIRMF
jgi:hypothetical protein